jgi:hypothetical protein
MANERGNSPTDRSLDFSEISVVPGTVPARDYGLEPGEIPIPVELSAPITGRKGWKSLEKPENQAEFLRHLAQTGRYTAACAGSGISRAQASRFRESNQEFQELCDEALARYQSSLEAEALRRAVHGTAEPVYHQGVIIGVNYKKSDRLLELFLKTKIPEFKEAAARGGGTHVHVSATASAAAAAGQDDLQGIDPTKLSRQGRAAFRTLMAELAGDAVPVLDVPTNEPLDASGELEEPRGEFSGNSESNS